MRAGHQEDQACDQRVGIPAAQRPGKEEGLEIEVSLLGDDLTVMCM